MQIVKYRFIVTVIMVMSLGIFFNQNASFAKRSTEDVVHLYMQSLISGDVGTLQQCLDKDLRERMKNTFQDPTEYRLFLIVRYEDAQYRILEKQDRKNGQSSVTMEIEFKNHHKKRIQLYLNQKNKIFKEVVL